MYLMMPNIPAHAQDTPLQPYPEHLLDLTLAGLVDGTLDRAHTRAAETHLADCLLCRIKRQRLSKIPPINFTRLQDVIIPEYGHIATQPASGSDAQRGELWLTTGDIAAMVVIRSVREHGWGMVVAPVTFNVEAADRDTLILDETVSPLGVPIAIYPSIMSSLPATALAERIVFVRDSTDLWALEESAGVSRGTPILSSSDPRLELHQYLADQLAVLDPYDEDDGDDELVDE